MDEKMFLSTFALVAQKINAVTTTFYNCPKILLLFLTQEVYFDIKLLPNINPCTKKGFGWLKIGKKRVWKSSSE